MDLLHKYTSHSSSVIPRCSGGDGVFLSGPTSVSVFDSTLVVVHGVALKYLLMILRGSGVILWVFLFTAVSTYRTAASRWHSPTGKWSFLSHLCIFFFYSMPFKIKSSPVPPQAWHWWCEPPPNRTFPFLRGQKLLGQFSHRCCWALGTEKQENIYK